MQKEKIMLDGTKATLSQSGRYYVRHVPRKNWKRIVYYTTAGELVPLASATCPKCKDHIVSRCCGDFVRCSCGESFVDTDRWFPERHRLGGLVANTNHD